MRRPHRTIETFDISLMAVVTKAMGAFLVLMLLLLPYYTPNPTTERDATELIRQLDQAGTGIDEVLSQLNDPDAAELRAQLEAILARLQSALEIIRRLEAELGKAYAEIARLEQENDALAADNERLQSALASALAKIEQLEQRIRQLEAENRQLEADKRELETANLSLAADKVRLTADLDAARQEIAKLREVIEDLKSKLKDDERAVMVAVTVFECDDVRVSGLIISPAQQHELVWSDNTPMPPEHAFWANFGNEGGALLVETRGRDKLAQRLIAGQVEILENTTILTDTALGRGDYIVGIVKQHPTAVWSPPGRKVDFSALTPSAKDCIVVFKAAARSDGNWFSDFGITKYAAAEAVASPILAITSDDDGIEFRAVRDDEKAWFDDLAAKALKAQEVALKANQE